MTQPFRFGIQLTTPFEGMTWLDTARKVEDSGYSSLLMPDHFGNQFGPVSALSAAAAVTSTLRVGALVFGNDYRHPVTLAMEMATLDQISEGRVEFGIGAGWMQSDYDQAGLTYDSPGTRIERLQESIDIIKKCWAGEPFDFAGTHYTISGYDGFPKPFTPGGPPIMIGGGGPRMLGVATRNADIVAITANLRAGVVGPDAVTDSMPDAFDTKYARVAEVAGDKLDDLELSSLTMATIITDDPESTINGMAELFGGDPAVIADSPMFLVGTVDHIVDTLIERRERWGFNYVVVQPSDESADFTKVIERLSDS